MNDLPDATATELAAALFQAAVTLGLTALFVYLYRRYHKAYFGWFALAWLLYAVRLGAIVTFLATGNRLWLFWHQVTTGWTALALLWAALVFSQGLRWRPAYLVIVLFPPVWSFVAIYRLDNFLLAAGPAVAFLSVATAWTAWVFARHGRRVGSRAALFLAAALGLWALHHLDYPFLRARGAWNPWGYYLDLVFVLAMGAGVLVLVLDDIERGLAALSDLSADLHPAGGADLLDGVLRRTLDLAGVRGSAIYLDGERRGVVRAAGACAAWLAAPPGGAAAGAITAVLERGEPATALLEPDGAPGPGAHYVAGLPILRGGTVAGVLLLVGNARDPFAALDARFLIALGRQVGAALEHADLGRRLAARTADLERLTRRMVHHHEEERRRLSRELHDETAQVFAAVKLQIGLLRERADPALAPRLGRTLELVDQGMRGIRLVTDDLRPALLDDLGLVPALRALAGDFAEHGDLQVDLDLPEAWPRVSAATELALYRATQEALANVVRHAGATRVHVGLAHRDGGLELVVEDDGRGLQGRDPAELERGGHFGLAGMHERVSALGGTFTVAERPGGGVRLLVRVPAAEAPA